MELSLAEFACFNLKSKHQILRNKAVHVSTMIVNTCELQLHAMNGQFIIMYFDPATEKPVRIDTVVPKDMIYLFAEQNNISDLVT